MTFFIIFFFNSFNSLILFYFFLKKFFLIQASVLSFPFRISLKQSLNKKYLIRVNVRILRSVRISCLSTLIMYLMSKLLSFHLFSISVQKLGHQLIFLHFFSHTRSLSVLWFHFFFSALSIFVFLSLFLQNFLGVAYSWPNLSSQMSNYLSKTNYSFWYFFHHKFVSLAQNWLENSRAKANSSYTYHLLWATKQCLKNNADCIVCSHSVWQASIGFYNLSFSCSKVVWG